MIKLQALNAYFTDRLMAAVQEIMKVVGDTLFEYQDETERTKRENEILRMRLRDVGLDAEAGSPHRTLTEQLELSSAEQDTTFTQPAVKVEFTEPRKNKREEQENRVLEVSSGGSVVQSVISEYDQDSLNQPPFPSRDSEPESQNYLDLKPQSGIVVEEELVPSDSQYQFKAETDEDDHTRSRRSVNLLIRELNPDGQSVKPGNGGRTDESINNRPKLLSIVQNSSENPSVLQGESSLSCVYCGKVFIHVSRLKSHLITHTDECIFRCGLCGKRFCEARRLAAHQLVHSANKPYSCNICGKNFIYSAKFKEHKRIHTGEKPYCCRFCGRLFSQSGHLKAHMRIHTGEKPYRCPECGTCFAQLNQIKRHMLTHEQAIS